MADELKDMAGATMPTDLMEITEDSYVHVRVRVSLTNKYGCRVRDADTLVCMKPCESAAEFQSIMMEAIQKEQQ